jgi:glutathione S-transferase
MQAWYRDALIEPWREAAHEEETKRMGVVLKDLRGSTT